MQQRPLISASLQRNHQRAAKLFAAVKGGLTNFWLPPVCTSCHKPLTDSHQLCAACWQDITFISAPRCAVTGTPLPFELGSDAITPMAAASPPAYDKAIPLAHYTGTMRHLIHKLKYQDKHETVTLFANWLNSLAAKELTEADYIIPIPLHRTRLWQRRFNQSSLIAARLAALSGKPLQTTILKRDKKTRQQVGLSAKQRQTNMSGAFSVSASGSELIREKNLLLIDDVITTGATANAAARTLKGKGAAKVTILALAIALKD